MSNLVDIATAVAEDTKNKVYGVFTDAYTMVEGVYNGKYTLAEGLKLLNSSSEKAWKKYFEDVTVHTINKWNSVALRYDAFLKTREALGLPLFDDDSTMVQEYDVSKPGWTKADDEYLRSVHNIVIKIAKYMQDVDNGVRNLVWDSVNQDAAILGVEGEPTITTGKELNAPVGYNPKNGDLLLGNFVEGQKHVLPADFISGAVGVGSVEVVGGLIVGGLLIVCLTVGTVLVVNKICDALNDHLARVEAADIRRQQDKVIKDCSNMCPPNDMTCYDNCLNKAQNLTKVTSEAVKTNEKARAEANAQSDTKKLYETITKVSFVALGIAAIGGVSYAIYRFAGPRPKQLTEGRYPRLERGSPMLDAEVVSSRTVGESGPGTKIKFGHKYWGEPAPSSRSIENWVKRNVNDYKHPDGGVNVKQMLTDLFDTYDIEEEDEDIVEDIIYEIIEEIGLSAYN